MDFVVQMSGQLVEGSISPEMMASFSGGFGSMLGAFLGGLGIFFIIVYVAVIIFRIICKWRVLEKAGLPGWGQLIPIYNIYIQFKLAGRPGGWTRWLLFPPVLAVLGIVICFDIAKRFKKHWAFGLGLLLLPIVFYAILAFDTSKYLKRK